MIIVIKTKIDNNGVFFLVCTKFFKELNHFCLSLLNYLLYISLYNLCRNRRKTVV